MFTTGIHSNGDLAADYAGLKFYRNLTEDSAHRTAQPAADARARRPVLARAGRAGFRLLHRVHHAALERGTQPEQVRRYTSARMRTLVRERCPRGAGLVPRRTRTAPRCARSSRRSSASSPPTTASHYGHHEQSHRSGNCRQHLLSRRVRQCRLARQPGMPATARDRRLGCARPHALWWAAREGNVEQVPRSDRATTRDSMLADVDGETPLSCGHAAGSTAAVRELASRRRQARRASLYGVTPLMLATVGGRTEIAVRAAAGGRQSERA